MALALASVDEDIDSDVYQYRTELDASTGTVSIVYPTWDYDSGSWVDGTGGVLPLRQLVGDGYDEISFSVSWAEEDTTATVTGTESSVATSMVFDGVSASEFTDEMQTALINSIVAQSDTITDASMISGITLTESTRRLAGSNGTNGTDAATATALTVGFDVAFDLEDLGFTLTGDTSAAEEFAVTSLVTSLVH